MTVTTYDNANNILSPSPERRVKFSIEDYDEEPDLNEDEKKERKEKYIKLWKQTARKALDLLKDPWAKYNIHLQPTKKAVRYRYNAMTKKWKKDEVFVKMEDKPFANGAMRECFRLKKISNFAYDTDWKLAMNYVCKRYIQNVDRNVIFEDVKLQMDSKLWAEEFNRHNPPKKIDIIQMSILEFVEEEGSPLYHLEHFIEGQYIKYNSNSGFVSEIMRMTPQAFSHFTFERSGHQLIVVDIQGVDDLYTDPQIHTVTGTDYGDGNLGTRGMALFFYSHQCNEICLLMKLTEFDFSISEKMERSSFANGYFTLSDPSTKFTTLTHSSLDKCEPLVNFKEDAMENLRRRILSVNSDKPLDKNYSSEHSDKCICDTCIEKDDFLMNKDEYLRNKDDSIISEDDNDLFENWNNKSDNGEDSNESDSDLKRRRRYYSSNSLGSDSKNTEAERFASAIRKFSRPAGLLMPNVSDEILNALKNGNSLYVLGQVHLDMARYYEIGKFSELTLGNRLLNPDDKDVEYSLTHDVGYNKSAAIFHLNVARKCGVLEAIKTMADIAYDLPHDLLKDVKSNDLKYEVLKNTDDKIEFAFKMMELAAEMSERNAIHFVAYSYETGLNLPNNKKIDWCKAMYWYEKALEYYVMDDYDSSENNVNKKDMTFVCPQYEILAKMGQMLNEGGFGLERNGKEAYNLYTEAAECALEAMKGKLATKYYELAEMCECDE
ncbi:Eukaryotic elongation factor 2 kinase [Strongyloides ratti]|uniref:Eukaryotic elongation factor 2 kinase n=1 Tax=Strongyloides ratti TaxID=34506 RepID=A0A090LP07_STRRB|nr:Eukaryotic elongation factor 2 kinase [Strongyloides ratti]CEF71496.1 Eukaryotic elongation factor 2 kinase [Strongyloides ratti]